MTTWPGFKTCINSSWFLSTSSSQASTRNMSSHCVSTSKTFSKGQTRWLTSTLSRSKQMRCLTKNGSKNHCMAGSNLSRGLLVKINQIKSRPSSALFAISLFWMKMFFISTRKANAISKQSTSPRPNSKRPPRSRQSSLKAKNLNLSKWLNVKHGLPGCCSWWVTRWSQLKIKFVKSNQAATPRSKKNVGSSLQLKYCKKRLRRLARKNQTMRINFSTTQSHYRWVGMANRYLTGCISFTVLVKSLSVRFVGVLRTGADVPSKNISRSGVTHTAWNVWGSQTLLTSKTWLK